MISPADAAAGLIVVCGLIESQWLRIAVPLRKPAYRLLQEVSLEAASAEPFMLALPRT